MPNFNACKRLWGKIAVSLVYFGNTYEPAWHDGEGGLRHDAHLNTTRLLLEAIMNSYAEVDAHA